MKTLTYIILVQLLFLTACQEWDTYSESGTEGLLKKVENENHEVIGEYTYKKGLLKESWNHSDYFMNDKNETYSYTFDENNLLIKKEGFQPGNMLMSSMTGAMDKDVSIAYEYDSDDRISKIITDYSYDENEELNYTITQNFEYPEDRKIITYGIYSSAYFDPSVASYIILKTCYSLNTDGDIETIEVYYDTNTGKRITSFEQDTYDNHWAPVNHEPQVYSKHNVLKKEIIVYNYDDDGNQSVSYESEYNYEYEYNSKGYPTKVTETWPNEIQNIKYYYYY